MAIAAGMSAGCQVVGMSKGQLEQALGRPNRINFSDYCRGPEEQRIYVRGMRTFYVYTAGGNVTGIQHGLNSAATTTTRNCMSEIGIRNLETTASSTALSVAKQKEMLR